MYIYVTLLYVDILYVFISGTFWPKVETGTGRQYFTDIIGLSSTTVI